eukprot:365884-Chlamydomonas_euryale.AAC.4
MQPKSRQDRAGSFLHSSESTAFMTASADVWFTKTANKCRDWEHGMRRVLHCEVLGGKAANNGQMHKCNNGQMHKCDDGQMLRMEGWDVRADGG